MYTNYCCNNPRFPVNHGKYWSRAERNTVRRMYLSGYTPRQIAQRLGRTRASVRMQILGE